jgi:uncharacterized membrane protein
MSQPDAEEPRTERRSTRLWMIILLAGLAGLGFTGTQIMEKLTILKDPAATLVCDVNGVLSCTDVLLSWQASVLGPPNALIGAVMFTILWGAAMGALLGSRIGRWHVVVLWGLAVFFLAFATWFMQQTAFSIVRLCLWCIGITTMVVVISACLTRIAARGGVLGSGRAGRMLDVAVRSGLDLIVWLGWWLAIGAMLWIGLAG